MKRIIAFASTLLLSLSSLLIAAPRVSAATITWDGGGGDYLLSTGTNWVGDVAPIAGDILSFTSWVGPSNSSSSNAVNLTNNLGFAVGGVVGSGAGSGNYYMFDTITVVDGASIASSAVSFGIDSLTAQGAVTIGDNTVVMNGTANGNIVVGGSSYSTIYNITADNITVQSGTSLITAAPPIGSPFPLVVDGITIENGATMEILGGATSQANITSSIILGGGSGSDPVISLSVGKGGPGSDPTTGGVNLAGNVTLLSDAQINLVNNVTRVNGQLTANGHTLTVNVNGTSTLMGSGTVGNIVNSGELSPGNSPGCLNSGNVTFASGSSFDAELGGTTVCTEYDQLNVTGTVNLGSATLNTSHYNGYKPVANTSYTIINNDNTDAVTSTFVNLPEGATFTLDGYVYKISYVGGDGNDVVLTVLSVPAVPDTGYSKLTSNSVLTLLATTLLAGGIMAASRRYNRITNQ